ncbi:hypothetical protein L7F22_050413 [Adiantum nelumboides]|nr:hypothetical protein [Adiantum nelumboides]
MEELHTSHRRSKEQRVVAAQSKHQQSRFSHVSKGAAAVMSPRSAPSPTSPLVHLDSPSTTSLSHLPPRSYASAQYSPQPSPPHCLTTESDVSSASACHAVSTSHEVPIHNVSSQGGVSLEQHLQHGDAGREEAMQSFILERFLPAAKTVAADYDRSMYCAGRHPIPASSSTIWHSSSTLKAATLHPMRNPSKLYASKNVTWSHSVCEDDAGYDDSVISENPATSCGFFCAGLKSAMSRPHNIARTSGQAVLRNKNRGTLSSSHGTTSSEEEDLLPKVKVMMQGTEKQRGIFESAPTSFPSSSSSITMQDALPRSAAYRNKNFAGGPAGNHAESNTRPSLNRCIKCNASSSLHQTPKKGPPSGDSIASQQNVQNLRCIYSGNGVDVGCNHHNTQKQTQAGLKASEDCQWNASNPPVSSKDSPSQAEDIKEGPGVSESALKDRFCSEDDELEFYDASSKFDTSYIIQSNAHPSQNAQVSLLSDEHVLVETDLPCIRQCEILSFDADCEGQVEVPRRDQPENNDKESSVIQQDCRLTYRQGNAQSSNIERSSMSFLYSKNTPHKYDKSSSSPKPGWPLGISSFQAGTRKALPQETKNFSDDCVANTKSQAAKMAEERWTLDGRCLTDSNTVFAITEEETNHCEKCAAKTRFSLGMLAPPDPPSPTTSSWLGKVLASKASKPSYLTTLGRDTKLLSAQKLDFILPSERRKELRWEDVVKGSQMHPEHFSFSEEIRHHHPANQDAMKPLTH